MSEVRTRSMSKRETLAEAVLELTPSISGTPRRTPAKPKETPLQESASHVPATPEEGEEKKTKYQFIPAKFSRAHIGVSASKTKQAQLGPMNCDNKALEGLIESVENRHESLIAKSMDAQTAQAAAIMELLRDIRLKDMSSERDPLLEEIKEWDYPSDTKFPKSFSTLNRCVVTEPLLWPLFFRDGSVVEEGFVRDEELDGFLVEALISKLKRFFTAEMDEVTDEYRRLLDSRVRDVAVLFRRAGVYYTSVASTVTPLKMKRPMDELFLKPAALLMFEISMSHLAARTDGNEVEQVRSQRNLKSDTYTMSMGPLLSRVSTKTASGKKQGGGGEPGDRPRGSARDRRRRKKEQSARKDQQSKDRKNFEEKKAMRPAGKPIIAVTTE